MISAESEEPGRSSEIPPEPPKRPRIGTPHDMPGTSGQSDDKSKIGDEFVVNRPEQQQQQEFLQSSVEKMQTNEDTDSRMLTHDTFWCFASSMSPPILRHDIADDSVITLVLENVLRVIREMIAGAKLIMKQAERKKLLCDDLNDWLSRQGRKPLYGFMEDNRWKKVGDVYVPVDDIIDLTSCEASVEIETLPVRFVNFYAILNLSVVAMVYLEETSTTIFMGGTKSPVMRIREEGGRAKSPMREVSISGYNTKLKTRKSQVGGGEGLKKTGKYEK